MSVNTEMREYRGVSGVRKQMKHELHKRIRSERFEIETPSKPVAYIVNAHDNVIVFEVIY